MRLLSGRGLDVAYLQCHNYEVFRCDVHLVLTRRTARAWRAIAILCRLLCRLLSVALSATLSVALSVALAFALGFTLTVALALVAALSLTSLCRSIPLSQVNCPLKKTNFD